MKKLYVFRGLPGSGKTTLARKMAAMVVEPDMFRYDAGNRYVFDSDMNAEVMAKAEALVRYAVTELKMPCIAVTATHVKVAHIMKYVALGLCSGYDVTVVECHGDYGSVHDVPPAVMAKMRREFEPLTDAEAAEMGVKLMVVSGEESVEDWRRKYGELQKAVAEYRKCEDTPDGDRGDRQSRQLEAREALWKTAGLPYHEWVHEKGEK